MLANYTQLDSMGMVH